MNDRIVLVDDDRDLRSASAQTLELANYKVSAFAGAREALGEISSDFHGVVVSDVMMPHMNGLEFMRRVHAIDPDLPVIMITAHADVPMAVQAFNEGAYNFMEKPFSSKQLVEICNKAMEKRRLVLENRHLRSELASLAGIDQRIIGRSPIMQRLRDRVRSFGATDADVLILGETGTGKELIARTLARFSPRSKGRFIAINCGALPANIIESELFGHIAGAFTGASKERMGKFEYASGGTVLLDEIESMPMELQVRLLRVLQERKIERLGSNSEVEVDIRILAASKCNLAELSKSGSFREDLYYRLNILSLEIPPLRERREDIPLLFQHFLAAYARQYDQQIIELPARAIELLISHDWPGNVRELQNAALRYLLSGELQIGLKTFNDASERKAGAGLAERMANIEKLLIANEIARNRGNLKACYENLGISRKTLYDKMQKYGLNKNS
jgi:two-component system C4-dicarboxylate transport response regulator DctD